jgi:PAS domain S-box-containing protein
MRQQERIQGRQGLQLDEQSLQILVETIPALMWRAKPDGQIDYVNKRLLEYFGSPLEEIISWGWMEKVHPDDVAFKTQSWLSNLETMTSDGASCRFQGADGAYRWFNVRGEPLRDSDGSVQNWYGTFIDIDNQKKAEEKSLESELKLRQIIETLPSHIWSSAPDGEPTHFNQRIVDYIGKPFEDFKHHGRGAFIHPDDLPEHEKAFSRAIQTGTSYQFVSRLRRADGEYRWYQGRGEPLRDQQGRIIQWYGLSVDIDEAKKAEDRLRRSEAYLTEAQRLSHTGTAVFNDTTILYWSDETYRIFGFDPRNGLPSREAALQAIHPDDRERTQEEARRGVRQKRDYMHEFRFLLLDGTIKYIEGVARPKFSASGELVEVVSTIIDVTERKRAEQALWESEARLAETQRELRQMIDTIPILVVRYSTDARRDFVNAAWKQYTGLSDEAALGTDWSIVAHPDDFATGEKMWRDTLAKGEPVHTEVRFRRADGQYRWFAVDRVALRDESGKVIKWYGTAYDIEERKRAEQALRDSEAKFRDYAETASDWYWESDPDHKFTRVTDSQRLLARGFGLARWEYATDVESEPEKWKLHRSMLEKRQPFRDFVYPAPRGDGSLMYIKTSGKPVFDANGEFHGYRGTGTDVTALRTAEAEARENEQRYRKAELELAHANRVAAMGQLTASITHEVNQPITAAVTYALAARRFLSAEPPNFREVADALSLIVKEGNRAGEVVERVRALVKKVPARKDAVAIDDAIFEVIALTRTEAANNGVSVRTQLAEGLPRVQGDRVQLQQVMLNLIVNAIQSMSGVEDGNRELHISTVSVEPEGVCVAVRDTGPGLRPESLPRLFEPFYTTKPDGMGMGLSICRSIVEAHGGRLWATPCEPQGALFQFTVPADWAAIRRRCPYVG